MASICECYEHCGCGLLNVLILILNIWLFGYPETILPTLFVILIQVHIYLSIHCTCCGRPWDTILTHLVNNTVLWTIAVMEWYLVSSRIGRIVKRFGSRADLVFVVSFTRVTVSQHSNNLYHPPLLQIHTHMARHRWHQALTVTYIVILSTVYMSLSEPTANSLYLIGEFQIWGVVDEIYDWTMLLICRCRVSAETFDAA